MTASERIKSGNLTDPELRALRLFETQQPVRPHRIWADGASQPFIDLGLAGLIEMCNADGDVQPASDIESAFNDARRDVRLSLTDAGVRQLFFDRRRTV